MTYPDLCVVDTNVPKIANLAVQSNTVPGVPDKCILSCIEAVEQVMQKKALIIDAGNDIFDEYRQQLSLGGQPGIGDAFVKWVHDNRWSLPDSQRVKITKNGESYNEFPVDGDLNNFDRSDRKFVAVSNAHPNKPPILQATDSKWWGWKDALQKCGIPVQFVCAEYIEAKYKEKMGA